MEISTAITLGQEQVEARIKNKRLTRRIIALSAHNIHISEGIIELLETDQPDDSKKIIETLLMFPEFKTSPILTQFHLDALINKALFSLFKRKLKYRNLTPKTATEECLRALQIYWQLRVVSSTPEPEQSSNIIDAEFEIEEEDTKPEMEIPAGLNNPKIILALQDEIDATSSTMALAVREQEQSLTAPGKDGIFALPAVQERMQEGLLEEATLWGRKLFTLPMMVDPQEFENTVNALSPAMFGKMEETFVTAITTNLHNRPTRSRGIVAKALSDHGCNSTLMENISFLCESGRSAKLQIEAVNIIVGYLDRNKTEVELNVSVITLAKLLEVDTKSQVRLHVINCLTANAELICRRLPNFVQETRLVAQLRTILVEDPKIYRQTIETCLVKFGQQLAPELITEPLLQYIDLTDDDQVLFTFKHVLFHLETDPRQKALQEEQLWADYFSHALSKNQDKSEVQAVITLEFVNQFVSRIDQAFDLALTFFQKWTAGAQVHFINLMDKIYQERKLPGEIVKKIAKFYLLNARQPSSTATQRAVLLTTFILGEKRNRAYKEKFWPALQPNLAILQQNAEFLDRFINTGDLFLVNLIGFVVSQTNSYSNTTWINIAKAKFSAIKHDQLDQPAKIELAEALDLLLHEYIAIIDSTNERETLDEIVQAFVALMSSPIINSTIYNKYMLAFNKATLQKVWLDDLAIEALTVLANNKLMASGIAEYLLKQFVDILSRNEPPKSESIDSNPSFAQIPQICSRAVIGIHNLDESGYLNASQKRTVTAVAGNIVATRPKIRISARKDMATEQMIPAQDIPDPFKNLLEQLIAKLSPPTEKEPSGKRLR